MYGKHIIPIIANTDAWNISWQWCESDSGNFRFGLLSNYQVLKYKVSNYRVSKYEVSNYRVSKYEVSNYWV